MSTASLSTMAVERPEDYFNLKYKGKIDTDLEDFIENLIDDLHDKTEKLNDYIEE